MMEGISIGDKNTNAMAAIRISVSLFIILYIKIVASYRLILVIWIHEYGITLQLIRQQ